MKKLDLSMKKVKAIFVSHEHGDHIKGVSTLANKYDLPVYITTGTAKNGPILIKHLSKSFSDLKPVAVGGLIITPFTKKHDAADPHSFIISQHGVHVGVFTDIGVVCDNVLSSFKKCHAVFLEANYDEAMLENGRYPVHLKNRIRGGEGHLSNRQALELFKHHRSAYLSHLVLSHLSKENNSPELVKEMFAAHAGDTAIIIASRYDATPVFTITAADEERLQRNLPPVQLGLFT